VADSGRVRRARGPGRLDARGGGRRPWPAARVRLPLRSARPSRRELQRTPALRGAGAGSTRRGRGESAAARGDRGGERGGWGRGGGRRRRRRPRRGGCCPRRPPRRRRAGPGRPGVFAPARCIFDRRPGPCRAGRGRRPQGGARGPRAAWGGGPSPGQADGHDDGERGPVSLSLSLSPCLSLPVSLSLSLSPCLSLPVSLSVSLSPSSIYIYIYIYLSISLSHSLTLPLSHSLTLSLSRSLSLSLTLSLAHSLPLSLLFPLPPPLLPPTLPTAGVWRDPHRGPRPDPGATGGTGMARRGPRHRPGRQIRGAADARGGRGHVRARTAGGDVARRVGGGKEWGGGGGRDGREPGDPVAASAPPPLSASTPRRARVPVAPFHVPPGRSTPPTPPPSPSSSPPARPAAS